MMMIAVISPRIDPLRATRSALKENGSPLGYFRIRAMT